MKDLCKKLVKNTALIEKELREIGNIPQEGKIPRSSQVIPFVLVRDTRGYIEKVVNQINGTYENGWFDACLVMIRRLIETLIIEVFESYGLETKIKDQNGEYFFLKELISKGLNENTWNLSRNTKRSLPKLKDVGDKSAHSRRFNAIKNDVDVLIPDIRVTVQELIYLAGLK